MTPFELINGFRSDLDSFVAKTLGLAAQATREKSEEWNAFLREQQVEPKTSEERKEIMSLKEASHGALPVEVRAVLEKKKAACIQRLQDLKNQFGQEEWWKRVEGPVKKLADEFIDQGVKKYLGEADTVGVSFDSLYANAANTNQKYYSDIQKSGTRSEKCPTCMAARPAGSDLRVCAFCGSQIFNV